MNVFDKIIMELFVFLMQHIKHANIFQALTRSFSVRNYFFKLQKNIYIYVYTHTHICVLLTDGTSLV